MQVDHTALQEAIKKVSTDMDEQYRSILLASGCMYALETFLQNEESASLQAFGSHCAQKSLPYLELTFFIQDLFRVLHIEQNGFLDHLAYGYLHSKLHIDAEDFNVELEQTFILSVDKERDIINAHLHWVLEFIQTITEHTPLPEMDDAKCSLGKWIEENLQETDSGHLVAQHHNLHTLTKHAYEAYQQGQFHRFLLLYIDVVHFSALVRQNVLQYFTQEELISISVDALTHLPNRFALLSDIESLDSDTTFFLFNIKDFSKVNLLFGQKTGDDVLKSIAHTLLHNSDAKKVYRIFGDEFGILIETKEHLSSIKKLTELIEKTPHPRIRNL